MSLVLIIGLLSLLSIKIATGDNNIGSACETNDDCYDQCSNMTDDGTYPCICSENRIIHPYDHTKCVHPDLLTCASYAGESDCMSDPPESYSTRDISDYVPFLAMSSTFCRDSPCQSRDCCLYEWYESEIAPNQCGTYFGKDDYTCSNETELRPACEEFIDVYCYDSNCPEPDCVCARGGCTSWQCCSNININNSSVRNSTTLAMLSFSMLFSMLNYHIMYSEI